MELCTSLDQHSVFIDVMFILLEAYQVLSSLLPNFGLYSGNLFLVFLRIGLLVSWNGFEKLMD